MEKTALKVFVIEDEQDVRELLVAELINEGFQIESSVDGMDIISKLSQFQPNVLLLDQRLPGKSGIEIVREIRGNEQFSQLPIIMVTGLIGEDDKLMAFDLGADDYITKPFMVREVAARIRAVHRRCSGQDGKPEQKYLVNGDVELDYAVYKAYLGGEPMALTLTEFRILGELLRSNGDVLSRDGLRERALGNLNVTDRTIDVHMASLRKKLLHRGKDIETVRGVGYRFVLPETVSAES